MWILPSGIKESFLSARGYVDSNVELSELALLSECLLTWRTKLLPAKTWFNKWNKVYWVKHLFGRILKPSMDTLFVGWWTELQAGIPCQPFSVAGRRAGESDPRHLWPFIGEREHSIIAACRPRWCFFENVVGHITCGYQQVRLDLERLGYTVEEGIFSAEEVGAPHKRERLFILAIRKNVANDNYKWQQQPEGDNEKSGGWINNQRKRGDVGDSSGEHQCGDGEYKASNGQKIKIGRSGDELGNPDNTGLQGRRFTELHECSGKWPSGENGSWQWPAGRNESQYNWEPPRLESKLGYVLNGYNFREDLLRMAGNSVVEQTAALAWITLWKKHLK